MEKINIYNKYFVMDTLCKKPKVYDDATGNGGAESRSESRKTGRF